jgi:hypothetical protein
MAIQSDDRIVVETPPAQRRRSFPMGIIVTGIAIALIARHPGGYVGLIIGLIGLAFFGPLTIALIIRAVRKRPALILDADGFTDHGSLLSAGYVPWQEVQEIDERRFGRRRIFVTVKVTDPAAFRARQPAWRRLLYRINGRTAAGDILIPDNVLSISPAELVKTMRRLQRAAQRRARKAGTDRRA